MHGWIWSSELLVLDEFGLCGRASVPLDMGDEVAAGATCELTSPASLLVRDLRAAHGFYVRTLGLRCRRIRTTSFLLDVRCRLHAVPAVGDVPTAAPMRERPAATLQVPDLGAALRALLARHVRVHQRDADGSEREVLALDASTASAVDGVFVDDPDGNHLELLQAGQGTPPA